MSTTLPPPCIVESCVFSGAGRSPFACDACAAWLKATAPPPPPRIAIQRVTVNLGEGPLDLVKNGRRACLTMPEAEDFLRGLARRAPDAGGYWKTDVSVTWANGQTWGFRLDLDRKHASAERPIRDELRQHLEFYVRCPAHMTADYHRRFLQEVDEEGHRRELAASMLATFDLGE